MNFKRLILNVFIPVPSYAVTNTLKCTQLVLMNINNLAFQLNSLQMQLKWRIYKSNARCELSVLCNYINDKLNNCT